MAIDFETRRADLCARYIKPPAERRPADDVLKSDALAAADVDAVAGENALTLFGILLGRSADLRDAERRSGSG